MARPTPARDGSQLKVKGTSVYFGYWPMYRGSRRYGLQARIYATNPFALIRASINSHCPAPARAEALACTSQAEFFYDTAIAADEWAAKPLLLYYSFMNLAKAYALTKKVRPSFDRARHGISEGL